MHKNYLAAACMALGAGAACAQSNISIYGIVDAGYVRESGGAALAVSDEYARASPPQAACATAKRIAGTSVRVV